MKNVNIRGLRVFLNNSLREARKHDSSGGKRGGGDENKGKDAIISAAVARKEDACRK